MFYFWFIVQNAMWMEMRDLIVGTKLNTDTIIARLDTMEVRVSAIESKVKKLDVVDDLSCDVRDMKDTISLLSSRLARAEIASSRMQDELIDLRSHSMKYNLLFNFDSNYDACKEVNGEDCVSVIRLFLSNVMQVPHADKFFIPVAHRLGKRQSGHNRAILAKFPISSQLDDVLKHANRLRNTKHYVARQTPAAINERHQFAMDMYKANRDKSRLTNGKLFIQGKLQSQFQKPVLPCTTAVAPIDTDSISTGTEIEDSGSKFKSYTLQASTLEQVKEAINLVQQIPDVTNASHIIYAYRLDNGKTITTENFNSDNDHGMGFELLKLLRTRETKNVVCFITRRCKPNYAHLGRKRFDHMRTTANEALDSM